MFNTSDKIMATKEVKACLEYYMDLKSAYFTGLERGYSHGWFLGERVYIWSVDQARKEWEIAKFIRNKMDKYSF